MANIGYIQITRNCNQECRFCSNPPSGQDDISFEKLKEKVKDYERKDYDGLILSGGEPTLYPKLTEIIKYSNSIGLDCRIITNGQKTADYKYLKKLHEAGLKDIHVSIYSHEDKIQSYLTKKKDSLDNIKKTLDNLRDFDIKVNINIVINKKNSDHLFNLARFLLKEYSFISHFVFNNLDPANERTNKHKELIPKLSDFEVELHKTLTYLQKKEITFRVERVPLCYLSDFEFCSTETRKIVKSEIRPIDFLDEKEELIQRKFFYEKPKRCNRCSLNSICAGLYQMDKFYESRELSPVFVSKEKIVHKILNS